LGLETKEVQCRNGPIKTTIPLHRRIMDTREFISVGTGVADFDIHYIERMLKNDATATPRAAVV